VTPEQRLQQKRKRWAMERALRSRGTAMATVAYGVPFEGRMTYPNPQPPPRYAQLADGPGTGTAPGWFLGLLAAGVVIGSMALGTWSGKVAGREARRARK